MDARAWTCCHPSNLAEGESWAHLSLIPSRSQPSLLNQSVTQPFCFFSLSLFLSIEDSVLPLRYEDGIDYRQNRAEAKRSLSIPFHHWTHLLRHSLCTLTVLFLRDEGLKQTQCFVKTVFLLFPSFFFSPWAGSRTDTSQVESRFLLSSLTSVHKHGCTYHTKIPKE